MDIAFFNAHQLHLLNELCTARIAEKVVQPGDSVLDLGANEGFHTKKLSELVGQSGKVHAFEPNPALWLGLLSFSNVRLWPVAVGDSISVETFILPKENLLHQVGSIVDPRDFLGNVDVHKMSVPQVDIDSLQELQGQATSFMKVDIERRELNCFKGARQFLQTNRPIIVFENKTPEIEETLTAYQYDIYDMVIETPLANVIAIPRERQEDAVSIRISGHEAADLLASYGH